MRTSPVSLTSLPVYAAISTSHRFAVTPVFFIMIERSDEHGPGTPPPHRHGVGGAGPPGAARAVATLASSPAQACQWQMPTSESSMPVRGPGPPPGPGATASGSGSEPGLHCLSLRLPVPVYTTVLVHSTLSSSH